MTERPDDAWIRRIELYLGLGSDGVLVLVDRARDALIGELVRALLRTHPDLSIVVSPDELRDVPAGSVVLYHAEPDDAAHLNRIRPVLKDRALRVVLWAQDALGSELPLRAPDLYDWISHRVECPREGAPRFVRLGLLAAESAGRPVAWEGSLEELRAGVSDAWPDTSVHLASDRDYDGLVEALGRHAGVVAIQLAVPYIGFPDLIRVRWAMAEAHRWTRVAALVPRAQTSTRSEGFWRLDAEQSSLRGAPRSHRVMAAALDLEHGAIDLLRNVPAEALAPWTSALVDDADPASALLRRLLPRGPRDPARVASGSAAPVALRAWGTDEAVQTTIRWPNAAGEPAWYAAAIAAPIQTTQKLAGSATHDALGVELALSRDSPPWAELADGAARLGHHDVAARWDLHHGSETRALEQHTERALVDVPLLDQLRIVDRAGERLGSTPLWLDSLRARVLCDRGELRAATGMAVDAATEAYVQSIAGNWKRALDALRAVAPSHELGDLRRAGIGLAAWACDATQLARPWLEPAVPDGDGEVRELALSARWALPLGLARPERDGDPLHEPLFAGPSSFLERPAEAAVTWMAAAAYAERALDYHAAIVHAAQGIARAEAAFAPREHVFEGVLLLIQGRGLARLGQPDRAIDKLTVAEAIVRRATDNERHPWSLMARFEGLWLRARHRGESTVAVDDALAALREALWPEHRDLRAAERLRALDESSAS